MLYQTPHPAFPLAGVTRSAGRTAIPGAIVVGAGAPPPGTHGRDHGPDRSRLDFSNWGALIDAQGWGREVTTCGYGDLQGGTNEDLWYTDTFSGTSSASPIVTGAIACVQGMAKAQGPTRADAGAGAQLPALDWLALSRTHQDVRPRSASATVPTSAASPPAPSGSPRSSPRRSSRNPRTKETAKEIVKEKDTRNSARTGKDVKELKEKEFKETKDKEIKETKDTKEKGHQGAEGEGTRGGEGEGTQGAQGKGQGLRATVQHRARRDGHIRAARGARRDRPATRALHRPGTAARSEPLRAAGRAARPPRTTKT